MTSASSLVAPCRRLSYGAGDWLQPPPIDEEEGRMKAVADSRTRAWDAPWHSARRCTGRQSLTWRCGWRRQVGGTLTVTRCGCASGGRSASDAEISRRAIRSAIRHSMAAASDRSQLWAWPCAVWPTRGVRREYVRRPTSTWLKRPPSAQLRTVSCSARTIVATCCVDCIAACCVTLLRWRIDAILQSARPKRWFDPLWKERPCEARSAPRPATPLNQQALC